MLMAQKRSSPMKIHKGRLSCHPVTGGNLECKWPEVLPGHPHRERAYIRLSSLKSNDHPTRTLSPLSLQAGR
jgi:hypothetical protein